MTQALLPPEPNFFHLNRNIFLFVCLYFLSGDGIMVYLFNPSTL